MRRSLNPAVQRRRLRIELQRAREGVRLTQKEVAEEFGWSLSKIIRIENGQVGVSKVDLNALLRLYKILDGETVQGLEEMADDSRRHPWSRYRGILNPDFMSYLWSEGAASFIRQFHPLLVPGLLQTDAYALRLIRTLAPPSTPDEVTEQQAEVRRLRQEVFLREDPPGMAFVLDEAVIPRGLGNDPADRATMSEQIGRLRELNSRPNIDIRILPFGMGPHVGLQGPYVLLEFPDPEDLDVLYLENEPRSITTSDSALGKKYRETFERMEDASLSAAETDRFLERAAAELAA